MRKTKIVCTLGPATDGEGMLREMMLAGMNVVGEKFKNNEVFVPEVLVAARAMNMGVSILKPLLTSAHVEAKGLPFFELSAAAHMGVRELMKAAAGELAHLPPVITYEPEYVERPPEVDTSDPLTIRHEDDVWIVEGPWLQKIMANVNFSNYESRNWFDRMLRSAGLFDRLEEMGIKDGDLVSLYNLDFEYQR